MTAFHKQHRLSGAQFRSVRHVDEDVTLATVDDLIVLVDATEDPVTVTLPPASEAFHSPSRTGMMLIIKKLDDVEDVTIEGAGDDEIDGSATLVLGDQHEVATLVSDGAGWHRLDRLPGGS